MARIRGLDVGRRLGVSFLVVGLLIVAAGGAGLWGQVRQHDIEQRVQRLDLVKDDIQRARYETADVIGMQGLVAADAGAFGGAYATSPTAYNREGELAGKQTIYESLGAAHVSDMTSAERAAFTELRSAWDDFFRWDDQAMALLKRNTPQARAKAVKSINGGDAAAATRHVLDITDRLEASVSHRMTALRAEQVSVERTSQQVLLGALVFALLLALVLSIGITRSLAMLYASLETRVVERTHELAEANEMLEVLSCTDALTGLANRRQFEQVLDGEWRRTHRTNRPLALMMIDVDFFKKYNDHYGHQAGDECLRRIGDALASSIRSATCAPCRYGGEEFVIVLSETDLEGLSMAAERVRCAVEVMQLPHVAGVNGHLSVSVGAAITYGEPWDSPTDLLARADSALYEAKKGGRNRVHLAPNGEAGNQSNARVKPIGVAVEP